MTELAALDGPHWRFAVDLYAQDGVSRACLDLQDRFGVDVIVLMVSLFGVVALDKAPNTKDIERLDAAIVQWRRAVVHPLREVRRHLKAADMGEAAERLREIVKSSELRSEQIELSALAPQTAHFSQTAVPSRDELEEIIGRIIRFYTRGLIDIDEGLQIAGPIASAALSLSKQV